MCQNFYSDYGSYILKCGQKSFLECCFVITPNFHIEIFTDGHELDILNYYFGLVLEDLIYYIKKICPFLLLHCWDHLKKKIIKTRFFMYAVNSKRKRGRKNILKQHCNKILIKTNINCSLKMVKFKIYSEKF